MRIGDMTKVSPLKHCYADDTTLEIGVDEVGRGPLFGRVYTACVILPKGDEFNHSLMKDSKRFHSSKKLIEASDYIKANCIAYEVSYEEHDVVDSINILQATQSCMHKGISAIMNGLEGPSNIRLLIDGNYFNPYIHFDKAYKRLKQLQHVCVPGGDNLYSSIAAASIIAKVARDTYIKDLCAEFPYLNEHYDLESNKGYGAKKHRDGIVAHGLSPWHRKTFGICKTYA